MSASRQPSVDKKSEDVKFDNVYVDANTIFFEVEQLMSAEEKAQLVKEGDAIPPVFKKPTATASTKSSRPSLGRLDSAPSIPEEERESEDTSAEDKAVDEDKSKAVN